MNGRRRLRNAYLLGSLLLLAPSLHASTAYAAPGDPPSGSPAGTVYQLPLQQGRSDAAPKSGGEGGAGGIEAGGAGGGEQQGEAGSLYRTENNFGSSSQVPGAPASSTDGKRLAGGGAVGAAGGSGGSGTGGGAGGEGSSGNSAGDGGAVTGQVADTGNTSVGAGVALLGVIGLLAAAVGVLSRRFSRRNQQI